MQNPGSLLAKSNVPGRQYVQLDVTRLASGFNLQLGLHLVTGQKGGPTLGILTTIHGDETMALMAVRELLGSIDITSFRGRVAAIPVANPLAVTVFNRQTPEQHGRTDLHEVFPGSASGNLTLEVIEELRAPVTGYLFFSRYSGVVDAGTKAFALAEEATSTWL